MPQAVVKTFQTRSGPMLSLDTDRFITPSLEVYGEYCPDEWRVLKQLVRPGMTVVEVGANIGPHTVDLARACAPGWLYVFEPQPRIFQILCANLALNGIANALAYPEAGGAAEGEAVIPLIDYGHGGNFGGVAVQPPGTEGLPVRVRPVDGLRLARLGLLKIDVEGFEPQVLAGARETIARCRPVIYIENDRPENQGAVIAALAELGYRLYWHTAGLFDPGNFRGVQEDIFGDVFSVNMLCIPSERGTVIPGREPIDPANWGSPLDRG